LRQALAAEGLPDAATVTRMPNGRRVRYAGLVICRQRPGTASGVTFMTLEDETGFVNLVVWPKKFEEYAVLMKAVPFLGGHRKGAVRVRRRARRRRRAVIAPTRARADPREESELSLGIATRQSAE
jgi:DNA polymerase III alpha subunit